MKKIKEIYYDISDEPRWVKQHFKTDFISFDMALNIIEDLTFCIEDLEQEIEELKEEEEPDPFDVYMDKKLESEQ